MNVPAPIAFSLEGKSVTYIEKFITNMHMVTFIIEEIQHER